MNRRIFWSFQFSYWTVYFLYLVFVVHYPTLSKDDSQPVIVISYLFLLCFFGIPLSLICEKVVNSRHVNSLSLFRILIVVVFTSVILGNIWVFQIVLLDKFYNQVLELLSITRYHIIPFKWRVYLWEFFTASLLLFAWIAIYLFLKFWNQWQKQRYETERAHLQLESAQLKMLQSQISPHFLFNALSSLRALIRNDAVKAEQMLSKISEFLRYSLINKAKVEVPFSEELLATKNYFSIEQVRFGDKLHVKYDIDPAAEDFPVPGFILHPLIENSVKYGMETSKLPLQILISAGIREDTLKIQVKNSGKWYCRENKNNSTGTGLKNVEDRLQTLYPGGYKLDHDEIDGFVITRLEIERDPNDRSEQND